MEITVGKYTIFPLDKLNWCVRERREKTDPETGETVEVDVRLEKYFSRPQYAAEFVYDRMLRENPTKLRAEIDTLGTIAKMLDAAGQEIADAVNALMPEDKRVDNIHVDRKLVLPDPETYKKPRKRRTSKPKAKTADKAQAKS